MKLGELVKIVGECIRFDELIDVMTWASVEIDEVSGVTVLHIKPKENQTRIYRDQLQSILDLNTYRKELEFYWEGGFFVVILHKEDEVDVV